MIGKMCKQNEVVVSILSFAMMTDDDALYMNTGVVFHHVNNFITTMIDSAIDALYVRLPSAPVQSSPVHAIHLCNFRSLRVLCYSLFQVVQENFF